MVLGDWKMRILKLIGAAVLIAAPTSAMACDLDGMGEHRFFAFANMARGGPAVDLQDQSSPVPDQPALARSEPSDTQSADGGDSDESSKPSNETGTTPSEGPSDGATFR
jgi:hypothetical protein